MNSSLRILINGLDALKCYLTDNEKIGREIYGGDTTFSPRLDPIQLSSSFSRRKAFEYNSYIISLYGFFERFIESISDEFLSRYENIFTNYEDFNQDIRRNNLELTLETIKKLDYPKYAGITEKSLIEELYWGSVKNKPCINKVVFLHHSQNFRHNYVADYLKRFGIQDFDPMIKKMDPIRELLENEHGNFAEIKSGILFYKIDDLAVRRNQVSHGVENIDILSNNIISEYIDFVKSYSISIRNILQGEIARLRFEKATIELEVIKVFASDILCVASNGNSFRIGMEVFIRRPSNVLPTFFTAKVLEIQVDNNPVEKIDSSESRNIGLKLSQKIKNNQIFRINK